MFYLAVFACCFSGLANAVDVFAIKTPTPSEPRPLLLSPYPVNNLAYDANPGIVGIFMQMGSDSTLTRKEKQSRAAIQAVLKDWDIREEFKKVLRCGPEKSWCLSVDAPDTVDADKTDNPRITLIKTWTDAHSYSNVRVLSLWIEVTDAAITIHSRLSTLPPDQQLQKLSKSPIAPFLNAYDLKAPPNTVKHAKRSDTAIVVDAYWSESDPTRLESALRQGLFEINAMIETRLGYEWSPEGALPSQASADVLPQLTTFKDKGLKVPLMKRLLYVQAVTADRIWMFRRLPMTDTETAKELVSLPLSDFQ